MNNVERAQADLEKMRSDMVKLQNQMDDLAVRANKVAAYIEMAAYYEAVDAFDDASRTRAAGISATAVRLATEMIRERKESMHTRQILKALTERGVQIGGANPVANLSGFLSRAPELRNSRAHGWGLAEWGSPPDEVAIANRVLSATPIQETGDDEDQGATTAYTSNIGADWDVKGDDRLDDDIPF